MFPFWFKWNGLIFIKTPVTAGDQGQGGGGQRSQVIMREIAGDLRAKHPVAPWVLVGKVPGGTRRPPKLPWWRQLRAGGLHREAERKQGATSPILEKKKRWPQETPTHCFASFIRARVNSLGSRHVCLCFHSASPSQTPDPGVFGQIVSNPAVLIYCCRVNGCILNSPIYAHTRVYPPAPGGAQINNV